ncbi:hypothetical protein B0H67DRAFT_372180 [Lasiosphaeris hirsuta]|uniref:Uncharacterized protein n=1 Tax=Lasiosphaeris hirsuta TaxID=260670 RepID=A0AA40DIS0_9PEZI|nr:hypothetical protein B0H67DRAFT_372180 [Lasiosphaeris hirsuta]
MHAHPCRLSPLSPPPPPVERCGTAESCKFSANLPIASGERRQSPSSSGELPIGDMQASRFGWRRLSFGRVQVHCYLCLGSLTMATAMMPEGNKIHGRFGGTTGRVEAGEPCANGGGASLKAMQDRDQLRNPFRNGVIAAVRLVSHSSHHSVFLGFRGGLFRWLGRERGRLIGDDGAARRFRGVRKAVLAWYDGHFVRMD